MHDSDSPAGFTATLRARTRVVHGEAERSGIIGALLRGQASAAAYSLFLRNLLPAYEAMEQALDAVAVRHSTMTAIARPEIFRAAAIRSDLAQLAGANWRSTLPVLPAGQNYAKRLRQVSSACEALLAHAYVRYLGDLNGGQILKARLSRSLGIDAGALAFYDFPAIADLASFRAEYRRALDRAVTEAGAIERASGEAVAAFRLNITISEAVAAAAYRSWDEHRASPVPAA